MGYIEEQSAWKTNGFIILLLDILLAISGFLLILSEEVGAAIFIWVLLALTFSGFVIVQPNEAKAFTFFGKYVGSIREDGFFWTNPFVCRKNISLRVHNFESEKIKVNDADGNPILIGAVIVWKVRDSAKALFDVDNYKEFVTVQSESAIRDLASRYPYDTHEEEFSLRNFPEKVSEELSYQLQQRLKLAGVAVIEAKISHLAYAPEIAKVMLRRQQANAIIAARQKIVEGAMGMVEMVLEHMEGNSIVKLDEERKASMANNLLVALVSEGDTHPVINTGTLYS